MAVIGELRFRAILEERVSQALDGLQGKLATVGGKMMTVGSRIRSAGQSMTIGLTTPIVGLGAAIVTTGLGFEDSIAKIETLTDASADQIAKWKDELLTLAPEVAKPPKELAEALFFVASAGLKTDQVMQVLEASAKASALGMGTTDEVARAATFALNAYADSGLTANKAVAILRTSVEQGNLETNELAGIIGRILPVASEMGVEFGEVAAALAGLSLTGFDAAEGATALRNIMFALLKPSKQTRDQLEDIGLSAQKVRDVIREDGLLAALQMLRDAGADNEEMLGRIFPRVRGFAGVLALTGENAEQVREIFGKVAQTTEEDLAAAFDKLASKPGFKMRQALTEIRVSLIKLSDTLLPLIAKALKPAARFFGQLADAFNKLPKPVQIGIIGLLGFLAVLGPLLIVIGALISSIGAIVLASAVLGVSLAVVGGVILAVIAIIALLAVAAWLVWKNWDKIKGFLIGAWETVRDHAVSIWNTVKDHLIGVWRTVRDRVLAIWEDVRGRAEAVWGAISDFFGRIGSGVRDKLVQPIRLAWDEVSALFGRFAGWLRSKVEQPMRETWANVTETFWAKVNQWRNILETGWAVITAIFDRASKIIRKVIGTIFRIDRAILEKLFDTIVTVGRPIVETIMRINKVLLDTGIKVVTVVGRKLMSVAVTLFNIWKSVITKIAGVVRDGIMWVVNFLRDNWDLIKRIAENRLKLVILVIENVLDTLKDIFNIVLALIRGDWSEAWDHLKNLVWDRLTFIKDFIVLNLQFIRDVFLLAWNLVKGIFVAAWDAIKGTVSDTLNSIVSLIIGAWQWVHGVTENIWNGIRDFLTDNWREILTIAAFVLLGPLGLVALFATGAFGIRDKVVTVFRFIAGFIKDRLTDIKNTVSDALTRVKDAFVFGLAVIKNTVVEWLGWPDGKVWQVFKGLAGWMYNLARAVVHSFGEGLMSLGGWLADRGRDLGGMFTWGFEQGIGRLIPGNSPSLMGLDVGRSFGEGIEASIRSIIPRVRATVRSVQQAATIPPAKVEALPRTIREAAEKVRIRTEAALETPLPRIPIPVKLESVATLHEGLTEEAKSRTLNIIFERGSVVVGQGASQEDADVFADMLVRTLRKRRLRA